MSSYILRNARISGAFSDNLKFSTKKFENEITRNRQTKANKDALVTVHDVGCVDSVVLTKAFPDKQTDFPGICSSLQKLGYLQQYIIPDYPAFYTLSERGEKIFTTQKSAEFLGEKRAIGILCPGHRTILSERLLAFCYCIRFRLLQK